MNAVPFGFVDLFAGCGGLSLGLEMAGFTPIFVNELSPDALNTYLLNRDSEYPLLRSKYHVQNVKELVANNGNLLRDLAEGLRTDYGIANGDISLVVGGPPCQGFSAIGHRRSYAVDKVQLPSNHLYQDMAFAIHLLRPKAFLFENVRGLLSAKWTNGGDRGEIWEDIRHTFEEIPGYNVRAQLIFGKDYGVPQNRPRVLLVGIRDDLGVEPNRGFPAVADGYLPAPQTRNYPDLEELLGDLVDPSFRNGGSTPSYPKEPSTKIQHWMRTPKGESEALPKGAVVTEHDYAKHGIDVVEKFKYMIENNGKIPDHMKTKKFAQRVLPRFWGDEGPTLTATSLPDDYVHFEQPRIPTVREWARIQTFPDWYKFAGKKTTGGVRRAGNPREGIYERELPKYTQIGNAVPVLLARAVGEHLKLLLTDR